MSEYMNKEFWLEFIDKTSSFTSPHVFENSFSTEDRDILYKGVTEVLFKRISKKMLDKGFRLYFEGEELEKEFTSAFLEENLPNEDEDIIDYCERVFDRRFGIIMNNNEAFSEQLSIKVLEMMTPFFDIAGLPPLGNEITVFIGNYGWTPLGIHKDHRGENVLHFHLGPGRKQMYTWDDVTYEKLVGNNVSNYKNIEPILDFSKKYDFGNRDIYYMPWFVNHVGYTEEISIGVSIWFQSTDIYSYSKKILEYFVTQFIPKDRRIIPPQVEYANNHDTYEYFRQVILNSIDDKKSTLDDFLKMIYLDFKRSLVSNGYWSNLPLENTIREGDYNHFEDKIIELSKPFKIIYSNYNNEKLNVFVRGNRIRIKYFKDFEDLLNILNCGKSIVVNEYIKNLDIPKEAFLYFLLTLYRYRGININNTNYKNEI